jgi:hypothetical protein
VPLGLVLGNLVLGLGVGIALGLAGGPVIAGSASRRVGGREEHESPAAEGEPTGRPPDMTGSVPGLSNRPRPGTGPDQAASDPRRPG